MTDPPRLPIVLGTLKVTDLGKPVLNRPGFCSNRYVYPVGYRSERVYTSYKKSNTTMTYVCEVRDDGSPQPLFVVTPKCAKPEVFAAYSATGAIKGIVEKIKELRFKETGVESRLAVSGPEFFGFYHETVQAAISELPNADRCFKMSRKSSSAKRKPQRDVKVTETKRQRAEVAAQPESFHRRKKRPHSADEAALVSAPSVYGSSSLIESLLVQQKLVTSNGRVARKTKVEPIAQLSSQPAKWVGLPTQQLPDRTHYLAFTKGAETYAAGDCVFLRPENDNDPPLLARIDDVWEEKETGDMMLGCQWLSRHGEIKAAKMVMAYVPLEATSPRRYKIEDPARPAPAPSRDSDSCDEALDVIVECDEVDSQMGSCGDLIAAKQSDDAKGNDNCATPAPPPPGGSGTVTTPLPSVRQRMLSMNQWAHMADAKELFLCDVVDPNYVGAVIGKAYVHFVRTVKTWKALPEASSLLHYFCRRQHFTVETGTVVIAPVANSLVNGPIGSGWTSNLELILPSKHSHSTPPPAAAAPLHSPNNDFVYLYTPPSVDKPLSPRLQQRYRKKLREQQPETRPKLQPQQTSPIPERCLELTHVHILLQKGLVLPGWKCLQSAGDEKRDVQDQNGAESSEEDTSDESYVRLHQPQERLQKKHRLPQHELRALRKAARKQQAQVPEMTLLLCADF